MVGENDMKVFVDEMEELVQKTEDEILKLEENPRDSKPIQELFFTFHTLKGLTAMAELENVSKFCHFFESFLQSAKEKRITKDKKSKFIDLLFDNFDVLRAVLKRIKKGDMQDIDPGLLSDMEEKFNYFETDGEDKIIDLLPPNELKRLLEKPSTHTYKIQIRLEKTCVFKKVRLFIIFRALNEIGQIFWSDPKPNVLEEGNVQGDFELYYISQKSDDLITQTLDQILEIENKVITELNSAESNQIISTYNLEWKVESPKIENQEISLELTREEVLINGEGEVDSTNTEDFSVEKITSVKVNIEKLENLMNYFGELVILKNQVNQILKGSEDRQISRIIDKMDKPFLDIQEELFSLKLVRVESTFRKYKRLVRDVAKETNKRVNFILEGINVDIDRKILEEINSPLIHILRNAISHGLETPNDRKARGKGEVGILKLKTSRRAGSIYIEVEDDGNGINYDKIKQKVVEKGIYSQSEVENLNEEELNKVILLPGFSTLSGADIISGRGMGLAIVSKKIKELGGTFKIHSEKDRGTRMTLIVPFTRAILKAQLIKVDGDLFAIPIENIDQVVIFNEGSVEQDNGSKYYQVDSQLLPIIDLESHLKLKKHDVAEHVSNSHINIAIFCKKDNIVTAVFVVHEILQQMDIVVKPFTSNFSDSHNILGSTVTGDGSICLILDVLSIMSSLTQEKKILNVVA